MKAEERRAVGSSASPSVLAVVVDCSPVEWAARPADELPHLLEQLMMLCSAYWSLASSNRLLVVGAHPAAARLLWPERRELAAEVAPPHRLRAALARGVRGLVALDPLSDAAAPALAAALSLALCRLERVRREEPLAQPRVLLLSASAECPSASLRLTNAAFAAKKLEALGRLFSHRQQRRPRAPAAAPASHRVAIDTALLAPTARLDLVLLAPTADSISLQQLALSACGIGWHHAASPVLPDQHCRRLLAPPPQSRLETRAVCTLTKRHLDIGYTCSVCLAVFEKHSLRECAVCGTRFPLPKLAPGAKLKKKVAKAK
ncbi:hypothetical protein EMIHUDRAFT_97898 [Emiliania huxleyi CCMP1516]|uniref:General transcription factor IIH subunit 3 n=2 Tax=Emiliania huxleyi TaxID=2903 RepID=A0A0D3KQF9_EMIH1|nr:hypothetical protein EMIHUDRAFT_97898 [Emiliania huxleyi CCMP1516]EOD37994.1 hypothetical protein EMIHUDRAFT_97898 [Emiliania huxleyi CCMP1516]|eukprot:XP_005790423.1 hypothetical protein EMIHUDRAFT_97898 [Emiliania huxleyi CCMP1516]